MNFFLKFLIKHNLKIIINFFIYSYEHDITFIEYEDIISMFEYAVNNNM